MEEKALIVEAAIHVLGVERGRCEQKRGEGVLESREVSGMQQTWLRYHLWYYSLALAFTRSFLSF